MRQIKTILIDNPTDFDDQVNTCLADGWKLTERKMLQTPADCSDYFYAELEKEVIPEAERCCRNCKFCEVSAKDEPCLSCSDGADKWEAEE